MSLAVIALNQILVMFLIMVLGFLCFKLKIINHETNKKLSDFLLLIVNPLLIFNSYQRDFNKELFQGLLVSFVLALVSHIVAIGIAQLLVRGKGNKDLPLERFSCIYSNCGFMGIPLINSLYGSEGVFYLTAYMTVFNLFIWTHGVIMMTGQRSIKAMVKTLISPTFIAIVIGFALFLLDIRVPEVLYRSMDYVASMNTPLAMIIAGVTLAQSEIKKVLFKRRIYLVILMKQILIPAVLVLLYYRLPLNPEIITTAVLAAGCPVAATGMLFALRYHKNHLYASELYSISTMAALVTIPAVMLFAGLFIR
ncbi:AEC family transporter [Anaerocolumna jejuensis]|uniref:AEC family transporter n=1 Tax=Anaerocolumna jejuensis TaxID=259063 RepID=UPI003F7B7EAC